VNLAGLVTYAWVLVAPRRAFAQLSSARTWGWAAVCGLCLTLVSVLLSQHAQAHMMDLVEARRLATMTPGQRLPEQIAAAQVAPLRQTFFVAGAIVAPWLVWLLIAIFFFLAAVLGRGRPKFGNAWATSLNSYAPYGVAAVVNAALVALRDPSTISRPTDLVRLPSPAWLVPHSPELAAFLTAYNLGAIWYYGVVVVALETVMRMPRPAAIGATMVLSLLFGALGVYGGVGSP
jgi:hypothetical protein